MSAQWTVTGSAAIWLSNKGEGPRIKHVTFGKIVDLGVKDANNMGAAMAPAAYDSLSRHLQDTGIDYDLVVTGDLGIIGKGIVNKMFNEENKSIESKYDDCGTIIFDVEKQDVHAGGSGCGCSAIVFGSFLYKKLVNKDIKRLLFTATGALHSPTATLQGESIPGIAHCLGTVSYTHLGYLIFELQKFEATRAAKDAEEIISTFPDFNKINTEEESFSSFEIFDKNLNTFYTSGGSGRYADNLIVIAEKIVFSNEYILSLIHI